MKVLILYTHNKGFLSQFYQELSRLLNAEGFEVINVSFKNKNYQETNNGVKLFSYKRKGYVLNYIRIFNIIKNTKPDIVISNFSYVNPALVFGKLFKVKKNIVWFHSLKEQMNPPKYKLVVKSWFLKLTDKVVANSKLTQEELHAIYKVPKEKITCIPFWSTLSEIEPKSVYLPKNSDEKFKIGCPGRLVSHKNQRIVLEAVSRFNREQLNNSVIYFAGKGEDEEHLKAIASKLSIENKVFFLGNLTTPEMKFFYKEMDVIVLPSLHEAFGLVLIEALESNAKILVSKAFGALCFIENCQENFEKNIFDPTDVNELTGKLTAFYKGLNTPEGFDNKLYQSTFNKTAIFNKVLKELLS